MAHRLYPMLPATVLSTQLGVIYYNFEDSNLLIKTIALHLRSLQHTLYGFACAIHNGKGNNEFTKKVSVYYPGNV